MPFKSELQRRKFHATPSLRKYIPEWEADTPSSLPLRAGPPTRKPKPAYGHSAVIRALARRTK